MTITYFLRNSFAFRGYSPSVFSHPVPHLSVQRPVSLKPHATYHMLPWSKKGEKNFLTTNYAS